MIEGTLCVLLGYSIVKRSSHPTAFMPSTGPFGIENTREAVPTVAYTHTRTHTHGHTRTRVISSNLKRQGFTTRPEVFS